MDFLYFKLAISVNSFYDEQLNVSLDQSKPAGWIDLSNINQHIIESLNNGVIVQISSTDYYNFQAQGYALTTPPLIVDPNTILPYKYSLGPLNALPPTLDGSKYYVLGNTPLAPFSAYPQYLVRQLADGYHLYKPNNLDTAVVTDNPLNFWTYYGIWPNGQWVQTTTPSTPTTTSSGEKTIQFTIRDIGVSYSSVDLKTRTEIPNGAVIKNVAIIREGSLIYQGNSTSEYIYSSDSKIITLGTPVDPVERVTYIITIII